MNNRTNRSGQSNRFLNNVLEVEVYYSSVNQLYTFMKYRKRFLKPKVCDIIIKKKDLGVYYDFFRIYLKD
ncbi:Uncharacterised protein [Streptococcus pneumoniae]|nr:Uncharacterised protein [Streptococcus pneumoniae]